MASLDSPLFPRSGERGPVEATSLRANTGEPFGFPRSGERGPVEAVGMRIKPPNLLAFPRSGERGPVEARNSLSRFGLRKGISALW